MDDPHTEIGGNGRQLPATSHTALAAIRGNGASEHLVQLYWKPVYSLIRRTWSASNEDAKDLTQDFFAEVFLNGKFAERYAPERGSFRAYLKGAIRNFLAKRSRDDSREKRGGSVRVSSLHLLDADLAAVLSDDALPPEEVFDNEWRTAVLDRATHLLEERLVAQNKKVYFEVFRRYDLQPVEGKTSYESVGRELRISVDDVKNYLTRSREEFREAVRSILCESVGSAEDLAAEWDALFGGP